MNGAALSVRFGTSDVGTLDAREDGQLVFAYSPAWAARPDAFPISLTLPLDGGPYAGGAGHAFFANLLPEGGARQAVCRRLGISEDNDLALLRAIGGDCAGALSIVDPTRDAEPDPDHRYERLDARRIRALTTSDVVPLLVGGASTRLSLAGAQDKLPVALLDGHLHLPLEGAPSTHILKLPNRRYAHLTSNEAFVEGLAAAIDLDVVRAELFTQTDPPSLLVERYDRRASQEQWPVIRLHQEDLCQALGLPPSRKYEQEGGPTLTRAVELVRAHVAQPLVDVRRLIEWQAFNIVVGNSDGHGKNLSILYDDGQAVLAPFYDLLSTRAYDSLDRRLAMSVDAQRDPDRVHRTQWEAVAGQLAIQPRVAIGFVDAVAERCLDAISEWTRAFRDRYGALPILQTLPRAITRRATRTRRNLR